MQLFHILKELALEQGIQPTRGLEHYNLDAIMAVSYVVLGREVGRHRNPSPPPDVEEWQSLVDSPQRAHNPPT